jgi:hypothetical protein
MKTKRFDCVDMMHRGAKRIYRATKGMSRDEELEYWRQKTAQVGGNHTKPAREVRPARKPRKRG